MLEGDDRTYPELVAAALTDLVTDGPVSTGGASSARCIIVTATLAALFARAEITGAERDRWQARIIGGGPVGKAALRELMERANISLVVTDDDGEPLHVGRAQRLVTAVILRALIARSGGTCEFPGCHAAHYRCHAHHITWWRDGGETSIDNLVLLCKHHHRLVHHGWTITRGPDSTGLDFRRTNGTPVPQPRYRHGYGHAA